MSTFFAHVKDRGPIRYGRYSCALGVLESRSVFVTIGMALPKGWTADRLAVWRLHIKGHKLDGRFTILDGAFIPWSGELSPRPKWPPDYEDEG